MAEAPGHLLGQIIGNALESSVTPLLQAIADKHNLYLDKQGERPARPGSKKVTWTDDLGNKHDLDFVLERGGSPEVVGRPAAFIETAWRRYTKHSRAKAQEIQGALLPLLAANSDVKPFAGAVVAGKWTEGALEQMRSSGFAMLHVSYEDIVDAFAKVGIDVDAEEDTADDYIREQIDKYYALAEHDRSAVGAALCSDSSEDYLTFRQALEASLSRTVTRVVVVPLSGVTLQFATVEDAIMAVRRYDARVPTPGPFVRFEIQLTYSNGDTLTATFQRADDAANFLGSFA